MELEQSITIKDATSNPAPLGLLGFGITTILLNIHNLGLFGLGSMILAMGVFYGGIAQIIAGIMEWKKNNTFGATAFTSYGLFWLTLVALIVFPKMGLTAKASNGAMIAYLSIWGFFTLCMFFATLKFNRALQLVFGSLTLLFFLLALGDATGSTVIKQFAGAEGIVCGALAFYTAIAQIMNEVYGRVVLPIDATTPGKRVKKRKVFFFTTVILISSFMVASVISIYVRRNEDLVKSLEVKKQANYLAIQKLIVDFNESKERWPRSISDLETFARKLDKENSPMFDPTLDLSECQSLKVNNQIVEVEVFSEDIGALTKIFVQKSSQLPNSYVVRNVKLVSGYGKSAEENYQTKVQVLSSSGSLVNMLVVD